MTLDEVYFELKLRKRNLWVQEAVHMFLYVNTRSTCFSIFQANQALSSWRLFYTYTLSVEETHNGY